jgi:hypothetical protein
MNASFPDAISRRGSIPIAAAVALTMAASGDKRTITGHAGVAKAHARSDCLLGAGS